MFVCLFVVVVVVVFVVIVIVVAPSNSILPADFKFTCRQAQMFERFVKEAFEICCCQTETAQVAKPTLYCKTRYDSFIPGSVCFICRVSDRGRNLVELCFVIFQTVPEQRQIFLNSVPRVSRFGLAVRLQAGKQKDLSLIPLRLSVLFKSCGLWTVSC